MNNLHYSYTFQTTNSTLQDCKNFHKLLANTKGLFSLSHFYNFPRIYTYLICQLFPFPELIFLIHNNINYESKINYTLFNDGHS